MDEREVCASRHDPECGAREEKGKLMMQKSRCALLATGAVVLAPVLFCSPALAQAAPAGAVPAVASDEASPKGTVTAEQILKEIVVTGRQRGIAGGLMIVQRQPEATSSITAEAISQKMAITGPTQLIASLPGVNAGLSDPYNMSMRYNLTIRGLPMQKVGFVIDGMPPMDRAYLLPYSESWVDSENLAGVTVHPGAARILDPVQTAIAGEMTLTLRDPSKEAGGQVAYSHGSFHGQRFFGGIDTGEIGKTGLSAYATFSETKAGVFSLPGNARGSRFHTDFKVAKDWGGVGKSTIWVGYNDWNVLRSQPLTLAQFRTAQAANDYTIGNYLPTFNPQSNTNNYYKQGMLTRRNLLISWNNEFHPMSDLTVKITPYYEWAHVNSPGTSSLNPNSIYSGNQKQTVSTAGLFLLPNGNIPVKSNIVHRLFAIGHNSSISYNLSSTNTLQFGWWYDHFHMTQVNNFSPISGSGSAPDFGAGALVATNGQQVTSANFNLNTNLHSLALQDSQTFLDDRLRIEVGVKYFTYRMSGTNLAPGPQRGMKFSYDKILPRATFSFDINKSMQVYGNITTETRTPAPIITFPDIYNVVTGAISQGGNLGIKPETSLGEELGYRYHDGFLNVDIALFNKKLKNNVVTAQSFINGAGFNAAYSAGGLIMRGATAEMALAPIHGFSPYVNGQYLYTKTTSNFQVGADFLPTIGKKGVNSPTWTAAVGLNYDHGSLFGNILYKYVGSQYTSFMNDEKMPWYATVDLGVGYRLPSGFVGKKPVIRLSISNLFDKPYLGSASGIQPNAKPTIGVNGTVIAGTAPNYWLSSPRAIMGTFSTKF